MRRNHYIVISYRLYTGPHLWPFIAPRAPLWPRSALNINLFVCVLYYACVGIHRYRRCAQIPPDGTERDRLNSLFLFGTSLLWLRACSHSSCEIPDSSYFSLRPFCFLPDRLNRPKQSSAGARDSHLKRARDDEDPLNSYRLASCSAGKQKNKQTVRQWSHFFGRQKEKERKKEKKNTKSRTTKRLDVEDLTGGAAPKSDRARSVKDSTLRSSSLTHAHNAHKTGVAEKRTWTPKKKEQSTLKIKQHSRKKREAAAASSSFPVAASSQKQLKGSIVDVHRRVLPSKRVYIYRSWTQHSSSSPSLSTAY